MNREERISQFVIDFQNDRLVKKYLCTNTWVSGSSTTVYPIMVRKNEIIFQWNSDKRIFDQFINRTVERYKDLLEAGYFWKSDGSCPSTITFKVKEVST